MKIRCEIKNDSLIVSDIETDKTITLSATDLEPIFSKIYEMAITPSETEIIAMEQDYNRSCAEVII